MYNHLLPSSALVPFPSSDQYDKSVVPQTTFQSQYWVPLQILDPYQKVSQQQHVSIHQDQLRKGSRCSHISTISIRFLDNKKEPQNVKEKVKTTVLLTKEMRWWRDLKPEICFANASWTQSSSLFHNYLTFYFKHHRYNTDTCKYLVKPKSQQLEAAAICLAPVLSGKRSCKK